MLSRRWLVVVLALAAVVLPVTGAAAGSSAVRYAKGVPVCKRVNRISAGHATCFAMRRVFVKATVRGARPYVAPAAAGASSHATIGPNGGLTPLDLTTAYRLTTSATGGADQTIAIVDAYNDPGIAADLATFSSHYGLAPCTKLNGCLKVVGQTGSTSSLPTNDTRGWSVEETLDVEAAHAVCQRCHILLVEANSTSSSNLAAAVDEAATLHATEISNSYGGAEDSSPTIDAAYDHPGIVITASAGDDGYYTFDLYGTGPAVNSADTPAAYPTVVAVGGTSLYLSQNGARQNEIVWNDNGPADYFQYVSGDNGVGHGQGAGGGGCSTSFLAQTWQTHVSGWGSTACGTKRLVSDVSALADPLTGFDIYDSYHCTHCTTGWQTLGGTSLAAPLIAAIYGLAGGARGVDYPAMTLYGHLGAAYDVTVGGNGFCGGEGAPQCGDWNQSNWGVSHSGIVDCDYRGTSGVAAVGTRACDAAPGFDGPSGVGAPNGLTMFTKVGPAFKITTAPGFVHGTSAQFGITGARDPFPGGSISSYTWNWGDGTTNSTGSAPVHTYTTAGTRTITVTARDSYGVTTAKTLQVSVG